MRPAARSGNITWRALAGVSLFVLVSGTAHAAGLVGAYAMNEGAGPTTADFSGLSNAGTLVNGPVWTTAGKFGNALSFSFVGTAVDIGNAPSLQISSSMTLSAWIYSTEFPGNDAAILSSTQGGVGGFQLDTTADNGPRTIGFKLTDPNGARMIRYGATVIPLNQFVHVAGVYDATAQTMTVYFNGVPDNGVTVGTVASSQKPSTLHVLIGQRADAVGGYPFIGTIDEVRIYNRALSQAEIQADMNAAIVPPAGDTVPPSAPTGLAAAPSANQITLAWTASTDNVGVAGYRVERCAGAGCANFAQIGTTTFTTRFVDSTVALVTTYSYRVRATDYAGNLSTYSNVASATTLSFAPGAGRVGAYPFQEGSGTTTADVSGLGNNGTLVNGPGWTTAGKFGNALSFSFVGTAVDIGSAPSLQISGSMTLSAWIYSTAFPGNDAAIVSSTLSGTAGFQLDTTADTGPRTIGFKLTDPSGARMIRYGATVIPLNQFVHVAGVYDATAQTMTVYFNGVPDNGVTVGTVTSSQQPSTLHVLIGQRADAAGGYPFIGTIDEVRIYNRALAQAEIQADMNISASAPPPDVFPPTAPTGLSATVAGGSQINLSWTAASDNVGVTGYRVERCQGAGCTSFVQIATPTATSFTDTGLAAATSYSYRVRATDAAGNLSGYSNVVSATTGGAAAAQMYYIHPDHLNTPRMVSNQTSTTVWRWDQGEPFGNDVPNSNPSGAGAFDFPLRFPGQYFDRETNLSYNYFRDYDPGIGRYVQSDPVGLSDGPSIYAYVRSNPLTGIDLRGLTTYRGFDPQRENEMRLAVEDAKDKIRNCPGCRPTCQNPNSDDCFPDDDLKRKLIDKLEKATFVYNPNPDKCGWVTPLGWLFNRVNISDLAFGPRCCKLSSKLAHEAYHLMFGIFDPVPYKLEEKCFGCRGRAQ